MIFKAVTRVSLVYSFNEVGLRLRHSRDLSPKRSTDTLSRRTYACWPQSQSQLFVTGIKVEYITRPMLLLRNCKTCDGDELSGILILELNQS